MSSEKDSFKKELDGSIFYGEDLEVYAELRSLGMAEVGAVEVLNSFSPEEMRIIVRFEKFYGHYFG